MRTGSRAEDTSARAASAAAITCGWKRFIAAAGCKGDVAQFIDAIGTCVAGRRGVVGERDSRLHRALLHRPGPHPRRDQAAEQLLRRDARHALSPADLRIRLVAGARLQEHRRSATARQFALRAIGGDPGIQNQYTEPMVNAYRLLYQLAQEQGDVEARARLPREIRRRRQGLPRRRERAPDRVRARETRSGREPPADRRAQQAERSPAAAAGARQEGSRDQPPVHRAADRGGRVHRAVRLSHQALAAAFHEAVARRRPDGHRQPPVLHRAGGARARSQPQAASRKCA